MASIDELAGMGAWPPGEVEQVLQLVQAFDPIGVAARDLQECLLLQIRHLGLEGTPSETIVRDAGYLRLLQHHQGAELARRLGMPVGELKRHLEILQHLDPKPGNRLNPVASQYVIPDVSVVKIEDQYVAVLNEDGMPQLRISPVYRRMLDKGSNNSAETRAYVKEMFRSALWLIKSGRPAAEDHSQGGDEHHPVPARVPRPRHRAPASPRAAGRGHRHRHARVHGQPRGQQQVHAHARRACSR